MEQRLQELFPDTIVNLQEYRSFVNQPERIQISSQQDIQDYDPTTLTSYYNFRVRLPRPALNVKSLQLARASIPNCVTNFPDTECTWWYYALPTVSAGNIYEDNAGAPGDLAYIFDTSGNVYTPVNVLVPGAAVYFESGNFVVGINNYLYDYETASQGNVPVACVENGDTDFWIEYTSPERASPRSNYLRYVRLVQSTTQPELMDNFAGGFNRTFVDYDDVVTELNNATIDDPLNGEASNEVVGEFKFVPNQIAFSYDARFNKFIFTGLDEYFSYLPVASDDETWMTAAVQLQIRDRANTRFAFSGAIQIVQPWIPYRNLNLRLGFNYATYPQGNNFINMIRPIPPYIATPPINLGNYNKYDHIAPGYCDLVYTSCCHLYCEVTGGSTVDSIANKALLATIPLNTPNLGVGFHSLPLNNPLTKIANQLYEIYIEMRTDSGEPLYLGNNAIVSLEIILTYN
jgi:hypothetical protein